MIDVLKKTVMAGLGATVVTAEKVEAALDDLVQRGRLSADEAKAAANRIAEESKAEYTEARTRLGDLFDEMLGRANVATKGDLKAIELRLVAIEQALAAKEESKDSE
jgi:polyhydroxyalkanoate synthesis regulator phasin